jgi:hypothetical protein
MSLDLASADLRQASSGARVRQLDVCVTDGVVEKVKMRQIGKWTQDEVRVLRELASNERSVSSIAQIIGRSEAAVRGKAYNEGIALLSERRLQRLPLRFEEQIHKALTL